MPKRPARPVYFTKLELENVRSFGERQELNLIDTDGRPARWTLLVGDNGVGKTTLLQCLARMRPVFNRPPDENTDPTHDPDLVEPELAGEEDNFVLDALARSIKSTEAKLDAQLSFGVPLSGRRRLPRRGTISTWIRITRSGGRLTGFERGGETPEDIDDIEEPLVLAYGAGRHPKTASIEKSVATGLVESLFKVESTLYDAEDLLYRLDYRALKDDEVARVRLDGLKQMLVEVLPDLHRTKDIEIHGPPISGSFGVQSGVHVKTPYGNVPLSQLSLGYQTVFAWTVDMAWRLLERYPDSPTPLKEPAIVIVDEIDLHLHPRWQREIREHLTGHFPGIQFIATAHSPLMAQSSLGSNLAVLRKMNDHALILNDPAVIQEWRLDQVITSELFGLPSARPQDIEALLDRRYQLAEKQDLSADEKQELEILDTKMSKLPTAESSTDQHAINIIRQAAEVLKRSG